MKKYLYLVFISVILGACSQASNKKISIGNDMSSELIDTFKSGITENYLVDSLFQSPSVSVDTVIYKYESEYSKGDTTIENYKISCIIRPDGEFLPARDYGDSIVYVDEKTEFLMNVRYKDSIILSTLLTRERIQEQLKYADDNFQKYTFFTVADFKVEKDTFKMQLSLTIPDTDFFYLFDLLIANNGDLLIRDVTPIDDGDDGPFGKI